MNLDNFSIDLLRSLVTFVDSSNIVTAAQKLQISQPLLSKHLQTLERHAERPLFLFEGRKKILTRYGQDLYHLIKRHLTGLEQDLQAFELHQANPAHLQLRLGGRKEILEKTAPQLEFTGSLIFLPMSGREVLTALQERRLEAGISQHSLNSLNFVQRPLHRDRFHIAFPISWKLKSSSYSEGLKEILDRPYLSYGTSDLLHSLLHFEKITQKPSLFRSFPHWPLLVKMIEQKKGWGLVPEMYLQDRRKLNLIAVPEKVLAAPEFFLFYPRELSRLGWFQNFANEVQAAFRRPSP